MADIYREECYAKAQTRMYINYIVKLIRYKWNNSITKVSVAFAEDCQLLTVTEWEGS